MPTGDREIDLVLPSKEDLNVQCEKSILYRIKPEKVPQIIETIGVDTSMQLSFQFSEVPLQTFALATLPKTCTAHSAALSSWISPNT